MLNIELDREECACGIFFFFTIRCHVSKIFTCHIYDISKMTDACNSSVSLMIASATRKNSQSKAVYNRQPTRNCWSRRCDINDKNHMVSIRKNNSSFCKKILQTMYFQLLIIVPRCFVKETLSCNFLIFFSIGTISL